MKWLGSIGKCVLVEASEPKAGKETELSERAEGGERDRVERAVVVEERDASI
jgi:hypothetical protein